MALELVCEVQSRLGNLNSESHAYTHDGKGEATLTLYPLPVVHALNHMHSGHTLVVLSCMNREYNKCCFPLDYNYNIYKTQKLRGQG